MTFQGVVEDILAEINKAEPLENGRNLLLEHWYMSAFQHQAVIYDYRILHALIVFTRADCYCTTFEDACMRMVRGLLALEGHEMDFSSAEELCIKLAAAGLALKDIVESRRTKLAKTASNKTWHDI